MALGVTAAQVDVPSGDPLESVDPPDELTPWLGALAVLVAGVVLSRMVGRLVRRILTRTGVEYSLALLLSRVAAWLGMGLALFYALSSLGVQLGPVLGALGLTGLVVALALQSVLENVFAGLILQARRPFYIGDEVQTGDHRGRVTDVTSRVVRLRRFTGEDVFIPNSEVLGSAIINQTRPGRRRTDVAVSVAYGTDLDLARKVAEEAVSGVDGVRHEPPPQCFVREFEDSAIGLEVLVWHEPAEQVMWRVRSDAVVAIHQAYARAGITIPFPQRRLWFDLPGRSDDDA